MKRYFLLLLTVSALLLSGCAAADYPACEWTPETGFHADLDCKIILQQQFEASFYHPADRTAVYAQNGDSEVVAEILSLIIDRGTQGTDVGKVSTDWPYFELFTPGRRNLVFRGWLCEGGVLICRTKNESETLWTGLQLDNQACLKITELLEKQSRLPDIAARTWLDATPEKMGLYVGTHRDQEHFYSFAPDDLFEAFQELQFSKDYFKKIHPDKPGEYDYAILMDFYTKHTPQLQRYELLAAKNALTVIQTEEDGSRRAWRYETSDCFLNHLHEYIEKIDNQEDIWVPNTAKPVIYLYPEQPTEVEVTLDFDGQLAYTYPTYDDGWRVTAYPDGRLINRADGSEHYYLFWDGYSDVDWDFSQGFCVAGADTERFLIDVLSQMGLTPREYNDFIVYWLPELRVNAYNLITFASVQYEQLARLQITPQPDSILRVHMVCKPLEEPIEITPQTFDSFERSGFTVVEWGGTRAK